MDEALEEKFRFIAASAAANTFLIENLMCAIFEGMTKPARLALAQHILDRSEESGEFFGVASDDFQAERLADLIVRTRGLIDVSVGRVLAATDQF